MRTTSFGKMRELDLGPLTGKIELMEFAGNGKPHHHDTVEVALCLSGKVKVLIDQVPFADHEVSDAGVVCVSGGRELSQHWLSPGAFVEVPAGHDHWMEPDPDEGATMLIAYRPKS